MLTPLATSSVVVPQLAPVLRPVRLSAPVPSTGQENAADPPAARRETSAVKPSSPDGLTPEEQRIVEQLAQVDRRVRAHEQAHIAAGRGLVSAVRFRFVTGPDKRRYAVGGEVSIDASPVSGDPSATVLKAQRVRAAANAPAQPSNQDRAVAFQASQMELDARQELAREQREESRRLLENQNRAAQVRAFAREDSSRRGSTVSLLA